MMAEQDRPYDLQDDDSIVKELEGHILREEGSDKDHINLDAVAHKLIKHNFILTALELHAELQESGKELPRLKDYFSNPGNFEKSKAPEKSSSPSFSIHRSGSCQTFDSLDWARYSDDGDRQTDDRLAALEFELRKAQDTIRSLRAALTQATEHTFASRPVADDESANDHASSLAERSLAKAHEKRAINFLVNEYLLVHDYKLSSVTFAEENSSQDFESWEDVGLNFAKPPDLLTLYRDFGQHVAPSKHVLDAACQCEEWVLEELIELRDEKAELLLAISNKETVVEELKSRISEYVEELSDMKEELDEVNQRLLDSLKAVVPPLPMALPLLDMVDSPAAVSHVDAAETKQEVINATRIDPPHNEVFSYQPSSRHVSTAFRNTLMSLVVKVISENRIALEVSKVTRSDLNAVVSLLSRSIPHILPNVLLAKREELIPIILCAATLSEDPKERDKLLNCMFNLIKKPDSDQRQMILTGCVMFSQLNGPTRVEAELLPQCWEQINDKYEERRLLVAEACSALIPYLPSGIRSSLVLSMLQQMLLDEKVEKVRAAVVRSLGVLAGFIDDANKYTQLQDLLLRVVKDTSDEVRLASVQVLLPSVALWASELGVLETGLTDALLAELEKSISVPSESGDVCIDVGWFLIVLKHLVQLVPFWFLSVVKSGPYWDGGLMAKHASSAPPGDNRWQPLGGPLSTLNTIEDDIQLLEAGIASFEVYISEEWYKTWDQFDYICKDLIPKIVQVLLLLDLSRPAVISELSAFLVVFSRMFGQVFTEAKVKPKFNDLMQICEQTVSPHPSQKVLARSLVPTYACGILTARGDKDERQELATFLRQLIVTISVNKLPSDSLRMVFDLLGKSTSNHEMLLGVLHVTLLHKSYLVRVTAAKLCELVTQFFSEEAVGDGVLPLLEKLARDDDLTVRTATIDAFGAILEHFQNPLILEKVYSEFQTLLDDPSNREKHCVQIEIIATFTKVGPKAEPKFRDEIVLPRLAVIAATNNHNSSSVVKRLEVAMRLQEAYGALSCCFVDARLISECFLPGLRCLLQDMRDLSPGQHVDSVLSMMRDLESKTEAARDGSYHSSGEYSALPGSPAPAVAAVAQARSGGRYNVLSKLKDLKDKPSHGLFSRKK